MKAFIAITILLAGGTQAQSNASRSRKIRGERKRNKRNKTLTTGTENKIVPDQKCIDFCTNYFNWCGSSNGFINPTKSELSIKNNSRKLEAEVKNLRKLVEFSEEIQPRTNFINTAAVEDCQTTCMTWPRENKDPSAFSFIDTEPADTFNSNLGGDTFACRERHLSLGKNGGDDAVFHCPHATNPSTGICRDSQVNGYGPYELLRDGQPSRRRLGYCDLAGHDTIADCTDVGLSTDDDPLNDSFKQALMFLPDTVEVVFLNGNPGITKLEDGVFETAGLTNLQAIYLNDCGIEDLQPSALSGLSNLKVFNINMNPIPSLPVELFNHSPGLLQFECFQTFQGNNLALSGLPGTLFQNTPDIERIILYGHKRVTALPSGLLDGLTKLNTFSMVDSGLTSDGIPDDLFHNCTSLQFWDFFGNSMDTFDGRWFNGNWEKNLLRVTMWGQCNGMTTVDPTAFDGMDSLEAAYFHKNGVVIDPAEFDDKENFIHLTFMGGVDGGFCPPP